MKLSHMPKYSNCSLFDNRMNTCGSDYGVDEIYSAAELKAYFTNVGEEKITLFELIESRFNPPRQLKSICAKHRAEYGTHYDPGNSCQYPHCFRQSNIIQMGPNASRKLRQYRKLPMLANICDKCREEIKITYNIDAQIIIIDGAFWWEIPLVLAEPSKNPIETNTDVKISQSSISQASALIQNNHLGLCGLENIGNTCFMNSIIQCLSNIVDLKRYFVPCKCKAHLNHDNSNVNRENVAQLFGELLRCMWTTENYDATTYKLKKYISNYATRFRGYHQQDAHEFLTYLLDVLHEDLKSGGDNQSSIISELFHGRMQSNIKCLECSMVNQSQDSYNYLALSIAEPMKEQENTFDFCYVSLDGTRINHQFTFLQYDTIGHLIDRFVKLNPQTKYNYPQIVAFEITNENRISGSLHRNRFISNLSGRSIIFYEMPDISETLYFECLLRYKNQSKEYFYHPIFISVSKNERTDKGIVHQFNTLIPNLFPGSIYQIFYLNQKNEEILFESNSKIMYNTTFVIALDCYTMIERTRQTHNRLNPETANTNTITIESCIANLFVEQKLSENSEWHCSKCGKVCLALKYNQFSSVPHVLILQLKRFYYASDSNSKINTMVSYPFKLELTACSSNKKPSYNLIAVCLHQGSLSGGHYYTYAKHHLTNKWYRFDDTSVTLMQNEDQVISRNAYILFYVRNNGI
ncbi:unnamed protein product [Adineta steineri]|uniref:Ubiquitin carboxyl-terminal hydrolase n=1 Tax=Adineta steineri TaxID=433720 RepID=A0A814UWV6_9BILA|nr:unnamed protein product [Adineta steineri]CAF1179887.1 unnamed protein product [Adineta steineri]CAF1234879.1 unnamed protein product [Adineta steineri]